MPDDVPPQPPVQPLVGDPEREAVDTMRGYFYQVWQSVHAWVSLGDGQLLFLEKAEDFDLVRSDTGTAVQVFDSEQTITLRTEKIRKSIANFWAHRARNSRRVVEFRFLTRAKIGVEQSQPFGKGVAGLKIWSGPLRDKNQVAKLTAFVAGLPDIPSDLRQFLRTAPQEEIVETFLRRIHWDVENMDSAYVRTDVERILAEFGAHRGVSYSDSIRVADRLYSEVCTVASAPGDRSLTRVRFLEMFERETSERISRQDAALFRKLIAQMETGARGVHDSGQFTISTIGELLGPPPLPNGIAPRQVLVASLIEKLESSGALVITGSTGMGKTTLAKMIVASTAAEWKWARIGRVNPSAVVQQLGRQIDANPKIRSLVLDDADISSADVLELESTLGGILYALRERKGMLLITAQKPFPARLSRSLALNDDSTITAQPLTEEEIATFAAHLGCTDPERSNLWAKIALLKTHGHPQLVTALFTSLAENNWPNLTQADLTTPAKAILREQEEARQLLDAMPEGERELVYRLSIFRNPFRSDHARAIGGKLRALSQPGAIFEKVKWSWIEPIEKDYFQVSPLIDRGAEQIYSPPELRELHRAIVEVARDCKPTTTLEGATAFYHAWLARDGNLLSGLVQSFSGTSAAVFASIARHLEWFIAEQLSPGGTLFPEKRTISLMLRLTQFRVAEVLRARSIAGIILLRWEEEAAHGKKQNDALGRVLLALAAITHTDVPVPPASLLRYLEYICEAERIDVDLPNIQTNDEDESRTLPKMPDFFSHVSIFIAARSVDWQYLDGLLDALESTSAELRKRIFAAFQRAPVELRMLVQKPWLTEDQRTTPDWEKCLSVMHKTFHCGLKWDAPDVSVAALRTITIITDEHLHRPAEALQIAERMTREGKLNSPLLEDGHATVLFHLERYHEALAEWEAALSHWPVSPEKHDVSDALAARMAAISAARSDQWQRAASLYIRADGLIRDAYHRPLKVGLLTDAGFAYWRAGAFAECVATFEAALVESEHLPEGRTDFASFQARKLLGHILLWVYSSIEGLATDNLAPPQAGMASDMEKRKQLLEIPDGIQDGEWLIYLHIHERLFPSRGINDRVWQKLRGSDSASIRFPTATTGLERAFREREYSDLPIQCMELTKAMIDVREFGGPPLQFTTDEEAATNGQRFLDQNRMVGAELFVAALLAMTGEQINKDAMVATWRENSATLPSATDFARFFELVETLLKSSLGDATKTMLDQTAKRESRLISCVNIVSSDEARAEAQFYAQCLIIDCFAGGYWISRFAKPLVRLVERNWRSQIRTPAALSNPRITVPGILAACDEPEPGLPKLARIVLAAREAVPVGIPDGLLQRILALRNAT